MVMFLKTNTAVTLNVYIFNAAWGAVASLG